MSNNINTYPLEYFLLGLALFLVGVGSVVGGAFLVLSGGGAVVGAILIIFGVLAIGFGGALVLASAPQLIRPITSGFNLPLGQTPTSVLPAEDAYYSDTPIPGFGVPATMISVENPLPVPAGTCVLVTFSTPVADERFLLISELADILVSANGGPYTVEVAHSSAGPFKACTTGSTGRTTARGTNRWDVPLNGSPWEWVRICTVGPLELRSVEDLNY